MRTIISTLGSAPPKCVLRIRGEALGMGLGIWGGKSLRNILQNHAALLTINTVSGASDHIFSANLRVAQIQRSNSSPVQDGL